MTSVAVREKVAQVVETIDRPEFQRQLAEALPATVSVERFTRTTKLAVQLNPDILEADRASLFRAMVRCAQDGLLPDGREAALVKVKVKGKDTVAYWPMIGGFRKKAAEQGFSIEAHVIYSEDTFDFQLGLDPQVTHKPAGLDTDRGQPIGAYAVATGPDGRKYLEVMSRLEIEAVRATSRAGTSEHGPWVKWWPEMARKTVARRLFKQLPLASANDPVVRREDDAALQEATAVVPELAALPTVEQDEPEQEIVPEEEQ